jgi:hypothetical protein
MSDKEKKKKESAEKCAVNIRGTCIKPVKPKE